MKPNGQETMPSGPAELGGPPAADRPAGKFAFAGGSRPLSGFTIKRGIGAGGFGEIYYAVSDAGKDVALKLVRQHLDVELRGIRQCLNLKHPNLVALYDIRQDDQGGTWVVMEFIAGRCLQDVIAAHPQGMPLAEAAAWLHGIGAGVAYLHDRGIVHRDLKPGNIFCDEGLMKVGDYGLSKFISCSRRSGHTESIGTVHYMAPEVANGRYGKEIDIYALGVILYEMLTGRVPFEGESVGEVLMKHLTAEPDVSMLPEPYRGVVARALAKDPAKRFPSVAEMLARLPQPDRAPSGAVPLRSGADDANARWTAGAAGAGIQAAVAEQAETEEPIMRAVRRFWRQLCAAWDQSNLNTLTKMILLVVGMFMLVYSAGVWLPAALMLLLLYAGYRVVRAIVLAFGPPRLRGVSPGSAPLAAAAAAGTAAGPQAHGSPARAVPPPIPGWLRAHEQAAAALVAKPPRQRLAELIGSLLAGALVAIVISVVMVIVKSFHSTPPRPEQCAWLVLVSIAGIWAVLIPSKLWEGVRGDTALRRFTLMVLGLGVGAWALAVATVLLVDLPYGFFAPELHHLSRDLRHELSLGLFSRSPSGFYIDGKPLLMAHLACFGTLFLLIRWWRQADPLRTTRFSLWSFGVCVLLAWLAAAVWQFPEAWLMMVAGTISVAVQLASPWVDLQPRSRR